MTTSDPLRPVGRVSEEVRTRLGFPCDACAHVSPRRWCAACSRQKRKFQQARSKNYERNNSPYPHVSISPEAAIRLLDQKRDLDAVLAAITAAAALPTEQGAAPGGRTGSAPAGIRPDVEAQRRIQELRIRAARLSTEVADALGDLMALREMSETYDL